MIIMVIGVMVKIMLLIMMMMLLLLLQVFFIDGDDVGEDNVDDNDDLAGFDKLGVLFVCSVVC